jgi:hypothetical protein
MATDYDAVLQGRENKFSAGSALTILLSGASILGDRTGMFLLGTLCLGKTSQSFRLEGCF